MTAAVVVLGLIVIGAFTFGMLARGHGTRPATQVPDHLSRLDRAVAAFHAAAPWQPATAADAPEAAAAIEAALIAGDPAKALATAEAAVAAAPEASAPRVWLAWALCANVEPTAALIQLDKARALGVVDGALAIYVEARARHLAFELATGPRLAMPPLITAGDLAVVTLAGTRGGAAWLSGAEDIKVSREELAAAVAEHRTVTSHALGRALDALDVAPGFVDAAYLVARLAIKAGAVAAGRALFAALAPRMPGRPDAEAFARDLAELADPSGAMAAALRPPPPPTPPTAKRSRALRVLP